MSNPSFRDQDCELPDALIVHDGNQPYVGLALRQARRFGNRVIQLSHDIECPGVARFREAYVHMSSYGRQFDSRCIQRFFVVQHVMHETGLASVFHMDSDVLLFEDLRTLERTELAGSAAAVLMPKHQPPFRAAYGAHTSWWTRAAIDSFCEFVLAAYANMPAFLRNKWQWHQDNGFEGGICDMTFVYLWAKNRDDVANLLDPTGGAVFDVNVNTAENYLPDEFRTVLSKKDFFFRDGLPFCRTADATRDIRFRSMHCQARAKLQMERLAAGLGFSYPWLVSEYARDLLGRAKSRLKVD